MPQDQQQSGNQSQPTHTAAKVVIPFDIDLSQVETKLSAIEQRMAQIRGVGGAAMQDQTASSRNVNNRPDDLNTEKQLMMSTLLRTSDLLRQINDTVTLIYNTQMNNNG